MKKLLTVLTILGISASASATVVACGPSNSVKRFSTPTLPEKIRDQILVSLKNDEDDQLSNITKGKRFNDINFQDVLLKMLQDKISRLSNEYFKNQINDNLKLNKQEDIYQKELDEITSDIAQNQFYLQYTNNQLTNPTTSIDEQLNIGLGDGNLYSLNPKNLLINDKVKKDSHKYFIYMNEVVAGTPTKNWVRWQYLGENDENNDAELLPTIEQLQNNKFIILKDSETAPLLDNITIDDINNKDNLCFIIQGADQPVDGDSQYIYSKDGETAFQMNGKTALEYRFQEYFTTQIANEFFVKKDANNNSDKKINFFESLLTMTYLDTTFYNISRNENTQSKQDAFLNISSNLAQTIQTWSKRDGYSSNLKMIWSFTFKTAAKAQDAWTKINKVLNYDGSFNDTSRQTLKKIYNDLTSVQENDSTLGTDPFFNLNGYNGLVKNDKETVTSVDGTLMISEEAKAKIAQAKGPSILTKDGKGQGFVSGTKQNEYDFILVLPIYLIDLLNDRTEGFDHGQSTTTFVKKTDIISGTPTKFYSSYGKAVLETSSETLDPSKASDIQENLTESDNFYIYVDGVPYSLAEFNNEFDTDLTKENVWGKVDTLPVEIEGIQFTLKNTVGKTIGNIGFNQKVKLGNYDKPNDQPGIKFEKTNQDLYVIATDEMLAGTVVKFDDQGFNLSFDNASKDGVYTISGNLNDTNGENQGKTYSYKVNMGASGSNPNGYIKDGNFNYYAQNVSSLDISNLSTEKKNSLLREIEFVTSNETGVADTAAGAIFPLFLQNDQVLFKPLYDSLKKYLIDEEGGTSD